MSRALPDPRPPRTRPRIWRLILVLPLLTLACGDDDPTTPPSDDETIGPAGGTVTSVDGHAVLEVPAGALTAEVSLTVEPATTPPTGVLPGTAYTCEPEGTVFAVPVTLSLNYDPTSLPGGTYAAQLRAACLVAGAWLPVASSQVDSTTHTVTASLDHLSTYGVLVANGEVTELTVTVESDPDPDDDTQFATLQTALAYLAGELAYEDHGTVIVRTDALQVVSDLAFPYDLTIVTEQGISPEIAGPGATPLVVNAAGALSLQGFRVTNGGGLQVHANRNLTLDSNTLPDETSIAIGGVRGAPCPANQPGLAGKTAARARAQGASIVGNHVGENLTLDWSGSIAYGGNYDLRGNHARQAAIGGAGTLGADAHLQLEANFLDILTVGVNLDADASMNVTSHDLDRLAWNGRADGQHQVDFTSNTSATFSAGITGLGELALTLRASSSGETDISLDLTRVDLNLDTVQYADLGLALLAAAAGDPDYVVDVVNSTFLQRLDIIAMDNDAGKLTFSARAGSRFATMDFKARYEAQYSFEHCTISGYAEIAAHANVTDFTQSHVTYEAGVEYSAQGIGAALFVQSDQDTYQGNATWIAPPSAQFGLRIDDSIFEEGGLFYVNGGSKAQGSSVRALPSRSLRDLPQEVRLTDVIWSGSGFERMEIVGVDVPVIVESCVITQQASSVAALTMMQLDRPVTVTGNEFHGSGLNLQEVTGAVTVSDNEFNITNGMATGFTTGDGGSLSFTDNTITCGAGAASGFTSLESDAALTLTGNSINGSQAIFAMSIGGGTIHATDNSQISGVVAIADGLLLLTGNNLTDCRVNDLTATGGLLADPVAGNDGLTPDNCYTRIDWDDNGCCDYPPANNVPDQHGTCPCEGVSPPGG